MTFGEPRKRRGRRGRWPVPRRIAPAGIERGAQRACHLCDIRRTSLPAFDFDGADTRIEQLRQNLQHIKAGRLLEGMHHRTKRFEAALAQGGITGSFVRCELVDQYAIQSRLAAARLLLPAHRVCR